jgi:hypothetical protein
MFMHKRRLAVGTKIGEYLAASLPIITNRNCLGTVEFIKKYNQIGQVVNLGLGDKDKRLSILSNNISGLASFLLSLSYLEKLSCELFDNKKISSLYYEQYDFLK